MRKSISADRLCSGLCGEAVSQVAISQLSPASVCTSPALERASVRCTLEAQLLGKDPQEQSRAQSYCQAPGLPVKNKATAGYGRSSETLICHSALLAV